ncbi:hypothetical protein ASD76_00510 [Altererythrobacter sp. Root672]|nr:hypothetical protein [Altererythrobacter sp. Root672]KRA82620.1 hypothetical protein ASD76_00510 [Altererythrobacter sp. Root672]
MAGGNPGKSPQQQVEALLLDQPAHGHHGLGGGRLGRDLYGGRHDRIGDHPSTAPHLLGKEVHGVGRHRHEAERRRIELGAQDRPDPAEVLDFRVVAFRDDHRNVHADGSEQGDYVGAGEEAQDHVGMQALQRPPQNVNTRNRAQGPFDRRSPGRRIAKADDLYRRVILVVGTRRRFVEGQDRYAPSALHHGVGDDADDALRPARSQTWQGERNMASCTSPSRVARDTSRQPCLAFH